MTKKFHLAACALLIATLSACQGTPMPSKTPTNQNTQNLHNHHANQLLNQAWAFDSIIHTQDEYLKQLPTQTSVRFYQDQGTTQILASVGCNNQQDQISIDTTKQTLTTHGQMISTMMSCGKLDVIEGVFADFIANLASYRFDDERLILTDKAGNVIAFFAMTIQGNWQLADSYGFDIMPNQAVTLSLKAGKGHAYAGCNRLNFAYQDLGEQMHISNIASTRMACMDVPFEQVLVDFLPKVVRYQLQNNQLILIDKTGKRLSFYTKP